MLLCLYCFLTLVQNQEINFKMLLHLVSQKKKLERILMKNDLQGFPNHGRKVKRILILGNARDR